MALPTVLEGWTVERLRSNGRRAHFCLNERYVTVVLHPKTEQLYCLDSPCYHAAGPLGEGVVEDIETIPCIRCPWHKFLVALDTGEEVHLQLAPPDFGEDNVYRSGLPVVVGPPIRGARVQRVHPVYVDEATTNIVVEIAGGEELRHAPRKSDGNALSKQYGALSMETYKIKQMNLH